MDGWQRIYSSGNLQYVSLLKHLLESNEIAALILSKQDSAYLFGDHELHVKAEDVIKAVRLIEKHERE
ncbi:putative signal transducing protein [Sanyastnella coralliicola]|uniref:putative signal transducing protein n=1 Tax=Sanyastnella coralliicola TaxID=3069118 RepID=UPI0027B98261|nr:DUF2007 domain-containing protein [Longitalea sp. SCSIO 12813]